VASGGVENYSESQTGNFPVETRDPKRKALIYRAEGPHQEQISAPFSPEEAISTRGIYPSQGHYEDW
jgi:hypothetical protein